MTARVPSLAAAAVFLVACAGSSNPAPEGAAAHRPTPEMSPVFAAAAPRPGDHAVVFAPEEPPALAPARPTLIELPPAPTAVGDEDDLPPIPAPPGLLPEEDADAAPAGEPIRFAEEPPAGEEACEEIPAFEEDSSTVEIVEVCYVDQVVTIEREPIVIGAPVLVVDGYSSRACGRFPVVCSSPSFDPCRVPPRGACWEPVSYDPCWDPCFDPGCDARQARLPGCPPAPRADPCGAPAAEPAVWTRTAVRHDGGGRDVSAAPSRGGWRAGATGDRAGRRDTVVAAAPRPDRGVPRDADPARSPGHGFRPGDPATGTPAGLPGRAPPTLDAARLRPHREVARREADAEPPQAAPRLHPDREGRRERTEAPQAPRQEPREQPREEPRARNREEPQREQRQEQREERREERREEQAAQRHAEPAPERRPAPERQPEREAPHQGPRYDPTPDFNAPPKHHR